MKPHTKTPVKRNSILNKYALYEEAVQTPEQHAAMFSLIYTDIYGSSPQVLREDFCGTFMISCEWVRRDVKSRALCLDLDTEPLDYGFKNHVKKLSLSQRKRLQILNQNVISVTKPAADLVVACNFSFFIFKERKMLVDYFKKVKRSLKTKGVFVLEMAGGPGMIKSMREQTTLSAPKLGRYTYIWDQKSYNPVTGDARYAIHFKLSGGRKLPKAFEYDWRLWTVPEVRDAMIDAGFKHTHVYWEIEKNGRGTGEYARTENATNEYSYITYVVGSK